MKRVLKKNNMKITAVIPIRLGSERVINKCLKKFGDTNLLELKIKELLKVKLIDNIIVNTDSDEAIEIAKSFGVGFHKRVAYYASSDCPANEYFWYLGKNTETDLIAYTPVTNPFITAKTFSKLLGRYKLIENNSIVTSCGIKEFLWNVDKPLNFPLDRHPKSQDFEGISSINFALCLIPKKVLVESKSIIGPNPEVIEISEIEAFDIDSPLDFFFAEQYYKHTVMNNKKILK
jgi:CMP-N-acetylneuraminic acid synthetase